ncbi:MAG TPA: tRNA uridine(34) 5-carboxymethylaminomethyl modification radical SAM/GNAT enzyme Elp3 [Anaerolineaceae bacterium]|nr:tRNA uridine(34) 5-carboxymethylaminomethyl modification radical SAM/GNAT enzyme Elp3 [Anaerolineaceae bacterium]
MDNAQDWHKKRTYTSEELELAKAALEDIRAGAELQKALRRHPLPDGQGFLAKHTLVAAYRELVRSGAWQEDAELLARIRMKPVRTLSGVTTITVLTKPFPCPGECIFCPSETDMPQSYLPDEPGARRGVENEFDPYRQVSSRLKALREVGHPTDKIELLILGGSWSAYPREYREWFTRRCFEALNEENPQDDQPEAKLVDAQQRNETGAHRCVGLVLETRPDLITREELIFNRRLGATKLQIGIQSMDENVLALNRRGHSAAQAIEAARLIRAAGYKLVAHWMPNLLGATLESDRADFARLWETGSIQPDELKIYPCQLLRSAELYRYWERGDYQPYTEAELISLLADIKPGVPRYCRINRVIRDIPSPNVVEGNRNTSLRQDVARELERRGTPCACIRCREVRRGQVDVGALRLNDLVYGTASTEEHFLSFDTREDKLAGFLRLSLPLETNALRLADLEGAAIIREVHVYGQSIEVGTGLPGAAQHVGLGSRLLLEAERISREGGYANLAVISAVGTRRYYAARGFEPRELYMVKPLVSASA